ncbi:hypothetical protein ACFLZH_04980 [Patescibacteria group bacterium]
MADQGQQKPVSPENKPEAPKAPEAPKRKEAKEVKEATISVGIEAGEIIEGAEVTTGEVSEGEKQAKEGYAGGGAGTAAGAAAIKRKMAVPSIGKMTRQVQKELKKEIKFLNKKVKKIVKERDANSLNSLVARLRELHKILSKLASATADMIKDLWISYVKEKKTK